MGTKILFVVILLTYINEASCDCTFDDGFLGTWTSSKYETITVTKSYLTLGKHGFYINGKQTSNWTCHDNETSPYIILRSDVFVLYSDPSIAFICMEATQVNNNSIYFYMNSPPNVFIGSERIAIFTTDTNPSGNATEICTETASREQFVTMVKKGSEIDAVTDCPPPLHRNFTYIFNTGGSDKCTGTNGVASFCPDRQQLSIDYSECLDIFMYSRGGSLGCVASVEDGSMYYVSLYNYDSSPNKLTTFSFTCMAVENTLSGDVTVTFNPNTCATGQSYNTRPTNGGLATLTPVGSCEITTTTTTTTTTTATTTPTTTEPTTTVIETTEVTASSNTTEEVPSDDTADDNSLGITVGAVLAALLLLLLLLLLAYCLLRKKPPENTKSDKVEEGLVEESEEEEYDNLSIDHPECWNTPRQDPNPPSMRLYFTKDMITQTELLKQMKSIKFKKPPTPIPTPPPPEPPPPKYLPWPWRTAKRASTKMFDKPQVSTKKFDPMDGRNNDKKSLADYTISKYGIKYDDTGVDMKPETFSRQATKFMPPKHLSTLSTKNVEQSGMKRSNTIPSLLDSAPESRVSSPDRKQTPVSLHRSRSASTLRSPSPVDHESYNISPQDPLSMNDILIPTPSTTLNSLPPIERKVFKNTPSNAIPKAENHTPALKRIQMLRALSFGSIGSFSNRTHTDILMTTDEEDNVLTKPKEKEHIRSSIIDNTQHVTKQIPHYMVPIRSNTVTKLDKKMMKNPLAQNLKRSITEIKPVATGESKQKKKTAKKKKKKKDKGKSKKSKNNPYKEDLTLTQLTVKKGSNRIKPCDSTRKKSVGEVFSGKSLSESRPSTVGHLTENNGKRPTLGDNSKTFVADTDNKTSKINETEMLHKLKASTDFQDSGISADESSSTEKPISEYKTKFPSLLTNKEATVSMKSKDKEAIQLPTLGKKQKTSARPWY